MVDSRGDEVLRSAFNEYFKHWNIFLPESAELKQGEAGQITLSGWWITYRAGEDKQGTWLEFYAQHRMTNDRHVRFHSDGTEETLPALDEPVFFPENSTPAEQDEITRAARERYRVLHQELHEQGLV